MGAHAGQVAFVGAGKSLVEQGRNGGLQHRVAEKLEALVVVGTGAAMGQRSAQQARLQEAVAQALLQRVKTCVH
jgi:pyrroline-5-carboxylate reductase